MKHLLFTLSIITMSFSVIGQVTDAEKKLRTYTADTVTGWKFGGITSLTASNTQLYNWAAGGENSIAVNGLFSVFANYKTEKTAWDNSLDIGYGRQRQGEKIKPFVKTDDKIDVLSKYGRQAYNNFYYAGLFNFKTQMDEGRKYTSDTSYSIISKALAPAYVIAAIGMDYKPNKYVSVFVAPVTARITIVADQTLADAGAFGVTAAKYDSLGVKLTDGETSRNEYGGYARVIYTKNDWKAEALKNISFTSKLDLFSNYLNKPENVDINWENQIALKINKFITVNINTHIMYDDDIKIARDSNGDGILDKKSPKTQYKQILGLGFSYKF